MYDRSTSGFCWLYQTIFVGDWCIQRQVRGSAVWEAGGQTISPCCYSSRALMPHEKNYHLTKLEFLALKWVVTDHFKEYLVYQPFLVKTDNNPLTYIMMTPNLNATSHQWVGALAPFNFELEYQKGCDNTVADILSWVTTQLDPDMVRSILDRVAIGAVHQAKVHNPAIVESDLSLEWEVHVAAGHVLMQMHVTDWAKVQREDPILSALSDWLKVQKKTDLKAPLAEHTASKDGWLILWNRQNFTIYQGACICTQHPRARPKIFYFLWSLKHIELPPWMAAIEMQVIRVMIIPNPCHGSISGGQEWLIRCNNPSSPVCVACNMRAICPKCLYIQ